MSDIDHEAEFDEAFKGFGEDPTPVASPATDPPATPPPVVAAEPPKADPSKPAEEPNKDEQPVTPPAKKEETPPAPATDEKKPEEVAEPPKAPETPAPAEEPKPLTEDGVRSIISNLRNEERNSGKEIENTTKEVMEAYYPDGLSNVLTDQNTGKELKTPQDVVDATNGEMTTEQATQWLMNEQFKLDKQVAEIKDNAKQIAETTVNFRRDSVAALQKYEPLFKAYPTLQNKVFTKLMKQVKADEKKGVILSAPDVMEHYDDYLEPYQLAYEHQTKQSATNPVTPPETPPAPKPGAEDRLDEDGDGGPAPVDDPNDFAQQVNKELAKGI